MVGWMGAGTGSTVMRPGGKLHVPFWSKKPSPHVAIHSCHEWSAFALESLAADLQHRDQVVSDQQLQILELGGELELGVL
jgi:hypothetical protein